MQPQPAPQCPDKHGFAQDLRLAMNTIIALTQRQMEAVKAGDFVKLSALQDGIREARERKDSLLEAYKAHIREHGC